MLSLEQWVKKGIAPDMIVGSGKVPNDPAKTMSRPICPYPRVTHYKGRALHMTPPANGANHALTNSLGCWTARRRCQPGP
jgi:hypothetical protein